VYAPRHFRPDDPLAWRRLVGEHPLATLVTVVDGSVLVDHAPMILDPARGPHGTLRGHLAAANPHARALARGPVTTAVFRGPDAYVTPSWYGPGLHVPTWNYVAVHASGRVRPLVGREAHVALLGDLVATFEARFPVPWRFDPSIEGTEDLLRAIVGFEIEVERVESKWKLSQNREDADRARVRERLAASDDPRDRAVARWMPTPPTP
jgi:transcriptional regulator